MGGVQPTPAGARLLAAASEALLLLEGACADIRQERRGLTVSANPSFSSMWLARLLAEFSARHPETPLRAITQDDKPDFAGQGIDLAVVNVKLAALRPDDIVLLRETVFPVCSPDLLAFASTRICRCRLLQEEHNNSPEIDWRRWAPDFGMPADFETKIVRYSSFSQVVGAAIGGAGVALGRSPLIDPELASGRLVRVDPQRSLPASWVFALRRGPRRHKMTEMLVDFLRQAGNQPLTTGP